MRTTTVLALSVINMLKKFLCLSLALLMVPLWGCNKEPEVKVTDTGFIHPETGVEYVMCEQKKLYANERGAEYITVGEEIYYEVALESPSEFLCVEDNGEYLLYRATTVSEPTLLEFNPIAGQIFSASNTTLVDYLYAGKDYLPDEYKEEASTDDTYICKLIAEHISNGTVADIQPYFEDIEAQYFIHLLSSDYPGLYYMVAFFKYQGRYYLMERNLNKIVYCPNEVIVRIAGKS